VDCALWDLECKAAGQTIWERLNLSPRELTTVATIGVGDAQAMAAHASQWSTYPHLKIKLSAESPVEKMRAIGMLAPMRPWLLTPIKRGALQSFRNTSQR
jgi:L-alanine-DL-glutamate epimerase-like enolase superfamily enzyme